MSDGTQVQADFPPFEESTWTPSQSRHTKISSGYLSDIMSISHLVSIFLMCFVCFVCFWSDSPHWAMASSFTRFLDHTQRRTTVGRTPLDEWSARRRDLYLTKHNTHNRQTSTPTVGFEPTISAGERPQTYALDRTATGAGSLCFKVGNSKRST